MKNQIVNKIKFFIAVVVVRIVAAIVKRDLNVNVPVVLAFGEEEGTLGGYKRFEKVVYIYYGEMYKYAKGFKYVRQLASTTAHELRHAHQFATYSPLKMSIRLMLHAMSYANSPLELDANKYARVFLGKVKRITRRVVRTTAKWSRRVTVATIVLSVLGTGFTTGNADMKDNTEVVHAVFGGKSISYPASKEKEVEQYAALYEDTILRDEANHGVSYEEHIAKLQLMREINADLGYIMD